MPYNPTWNNPYLAQNPYQPMIPSQTVPPVGYQQPVNGIVQVNGRDSALQYQLPPNSTSPALFDKSGTCFYVVSTDGTGTKSIECFDFTPHVDEKPIQIDGAQFVSRKEFDEFAAKVNAVIGANHGPDATVPAATAEPDAGDDAR